MIDSFGRSHNYLRISLTERCNLRCTYCMPEDGILLRPKEEFMTSLEVFELARVFVAKGVTKIRLTGGEPLVRKDFGSVLQALSVLPVSLHITTNGVLIDRFQKELIENVESLNISLDTLDKERFFEITRRNDFEKVIANIKLIKDQVKTAINVVLIKGVNDDEIADFIHFGMENKLPIRFIEFMPFDGNKWERSSTVELSVILTELEAVFGEIIQEPSEKNGTTKLFRIGDYQFGVISTVSNPFCDTCNRIRLTADGKIKNCLFSSTETDLLTPHRMGIPVELLIDGAIRSKKKQLGGLNSMENNEVKQLQNRPMISIGG